MFFVVFFFYSPTTNPLNKLVTGISNDLLFCHHMYKTLKSVFFFVDIPRIIGHNFAVIAYSNCSKHVSTRVNCHCDVNKNKQRITHFFFFSVTIRCRH